MSQIRNARRANLLIVGGGGAAAMAALEANRLGVKPLLVCKDTFLGGATVQASGGTAIPFLPEDTPDAFVADTVECGGFLNNRKLVEVLSQEAAKVFYGLEQEGCVLDRSTPTQIRGVKRSEGHSVLRSYSDRRQIHGIVNFLKRRILQAEIPLLEERMLVRLFVEDGEVRGGLFFSLEKGEFELISAPVVVLATGGCGQLYSISTNAHCLTGDGYALAFQAGAGLVDMEMVQFLPLAFPYPATLRGAIIGMCSLFGPNVKLYNGLGERYMERYAPSALEYATRDVVARANYLEIQEGRGTPRRTIVVDPTGNDPSRLKDYREISAVIYAMIRETFGDKAASWQAPFEAVPSQHFMMGGVKIDQDCRTTVQNLLCCGEVSGGMHGANRLSGNALTEIYVFGKRAGRTAVRLASTARLRLPPRIRVDAEMKKMTALLNNPGDISPLRLRSGLQKVMWDHVGIVREGKGLQRALIKLRDLRRAFPRIHIKCKQRHWNREWLEALELPLMVQTAELIATSALGREESRGAHYRRDFPESDPKWLRNIVLSKDEDSEARVVVTPILN